MSVLAVCPHCNKSIRLSSQVFEPCNCPICDGQLTPEFLEIKNSFIDVEESNIEFETGKQFFDNTDFRAATEHFSKSLELNANHYMSFYYAGLCEVYENDRNEEYDVSLNLMKILKYSLIKLENAQIDMAFKLPFARSIYAEIGALLVSEYNKIAMALDDEENKVFRHKLIMIAKHVSAFSLFDRDFMLIFDEETRNYAYNIVDIALTSAMKSCTPARVSDEDVALVSDDDFSAAQKIFNNLLVFARVLDANFSIESYRSNFEPLIQHNKDIITHRHKYYESHERKDKAFYISHPGKFLENMLERCFSGVQFIHAMLYKNLYIKENDPLRANLLLQGVDFCLEMLMPRINIDIDKKVIYHCKSINQQLEVTFYLNMFMDELTRTKKRALISLLTPFFKRIYFGAKYYYQTVEKSYRKIINKVKNKSSKEFKYYSNFLYRISCSSALCLDEVIYAHKHKFKERKLMLKIGRKTSTEFFLIHDYNVVEIESNPTYKDIISISNSIEANF